MVLKIYSVNKGIGKKDVFVDCLGNTWSKLSELVSSENMYPKNIGRPFVM